MKFKAGNRHKPKRVAGPRFKLPGVTRLYRGLSKREIMAFQSTIDAIRQKRLSVPRNYRK